ncbi:MAG: class I SAM-dependent methyltransferase [Xanthomonadales bacterium]|nr:class I SAM-dependent methyltransferase [Xanthomonadales bacterium]
MTAIRLAERGLLPDWLIRAGIRQLNRQRLRSLMAGGAAAAARRQEMLLAELADSPLAIETAAANEQHYELPPEFFALCLGPRFKYSACLFEDAGRTLAQAEEAMLSLYAERAGLADGQDILELGCGWGSLSLWLAQRYPDARITGVSNSAPQRRFIESRAEALGLDNLRILTCDVNVLQLPASSFDRVVSIEMFEHLRNYRTMLARIAGWLRPGGALFVHIFCHERLAYPFETQGGHNWMGRYFFTGGLMPAFDTLAHFQDDLRLEQRWRVDGHHYQRTADAWLANHDANAEAVMAVMRQTYGEADAALWNQRWRIFWMACAETFGFAGGGEWLVGHYLFRKPSASAQAPAETA